MVKNLLSSVIAMAMLLNIVTIANAQSGCCSWHGGINYCGIDGYYMCNDGTRSPTCSCNSFSNESSSVKESLASFAYRQSMNILLEIAKIEIQEGKESNEMLCKMLPLYEATAQTSAKGFSDGLDDIKSMYNSSELGCDYSCLSQQLDYKAAIRHFTTLSNSLSAMNEKFCNSQKISSTNLAQQKNSSPTRSADTCTVDSLHAAYLAHKAKGERMSRLSSKSWWKKCPASVRQAVYQLLN